MDVASTIKKFGLEQAFRYLYKDTDKNLIKLMDWADRFSGGELEPQRKMIREAMTNPEHPYYSFIRRMLHEIDPHVMKTTAVNFFITIIFLLSRYENSNSRCFHHQLRRPLLGGN